MNAAKATITPTNEENQIKSIRVISPEDAETIRKVMYRVAAPNHMIHVELGSGAERQMKESL